METGINPALLPAGEAQDVLDALTVELVALRNQMAQFPITYYFHMGEEMTALSGMTAYLARLAMEASSPERPPAVRIAGACLGGAVEDFLKFIANSYLQMPTDDIPAIMRCYAHDQMRELVAEQQLRKVA